MGSRARFTSSMAIAVLIVVSVVAPSGAADGPGGFGCTVTALHLTGPNTDQTLGVANPQQYPCEDDSWLSTSVSVSASASEVLGKSLETEVGELIAYTDVEPRSTSAAVSATDLWIEYTDWSDAFDPTSEITGSAILFSVGADCVNNPQGKPTAQHPTFDATIGDIYSEGELLSSSFSVSGELSQLDEAYREFQIPGVGTLKLFDVHQRDTDPGHKDDQIDMTVFSLQTAEHTLNLGEVLVDFTNQPCAPGQTKS